MCSFSMKKISSSGEAMESEVQNKELIETDQTSSVLLELSATNDLTAFRKAVEEEGHDVDEVGLWYGRKVGSKAMGLEERTPLMIAAMFGSIDILKYIIQKGVNVDVNRACGSDGATALHCCASGGSSNSLEAIKILINSSANENQVDSNGNRPVDVIAPCFRSSKLEIILKKGENGEESFDEHLDVSSPKSSNDGYGSEKKEYRVDPSLPDIKNGVYGTDEFRMYTFKIKPCSRAYSHDWTECPFVHPGENARRRDPLKYNYSCVPCPEFRKGTCTKADFCEYAHGIFECWLHPAQYRTRLCKDETNCTRRVCFFAHKRDELRPLYASTGSGVPSPRSYSSGTSPFDMSPLGLGLPSMSASSPPMTPTGASSWQNYRNITPPTLHLPCSRLKAGLSARDMNLEDGFQRQQFLDELAGLSLSSPSSWNSSFNTSPAFSLKPTNLDDMYARQNMNHQIFPGYSSGLPSSPVRGSSYGTEPCGSPVSNARLATFAKRSQSFVDRNTVNRHSGGFSSPSHISDWGSPDGKLDWGVQGDELNKLRKSASFGLRSNIGGNYSSHPGINDPDVSWVNSLVKDGPAGNPGQLNSGGSERIPPWVEQLYMEQEPMVA